MKKYISIIPIQTNMIPSTCKSINMPEFEYNDPVLIPIMSAIYNTAKAGEEIEVISIVTQQENCRKLYKQIEQDIGKWASDHDVRCTFTQISKAHTETSDVLLKLFSDLLDVIDDGDTFYACVTFGAKPTSFVEMMALNYAYNVKQDVQIGRILYTWKDMSPDGVDKPRELYDMSALFFMDTIVSKLAALKVRDPKAGLQSLIQSMEEDRNDESE